MILNVGDWMYKYLWSNVGVGNFTAALIASAIAASFWPPVRKRFHKAIDAKLAPLHEKIAHIHTHLEAATGVPKPEVINDDQNPN